MATGLEEGVSSEASSQPLAATQRLDNDVDHVTTTTATASRIEDETQIA